MSLGLALSGAGVSACSDAPDVQLSPSATNSSGSLPVPIPVGPVIAQRAVAEPNPLGLAAPALDVTAGATVFTVPERMLASAKLGTALALHAASVTGRDGENLVIDGRDGPDYKVHPAYVLPLVPGKHPKFEAPVIAEWGGALRHGVVRKYVKDKVVIRFTDTDDNGDRTLSFDRVMAQTDGFRAGNYAVHRSGPDYDHVLLVSALGDPKDAAGRTWLCLGYAGASSVVPESELVAVPVSYTPKEGTRVWAEHLGRMREGVVKAVDRPGLLTIKFERAGRPLVKGWGFVMPPVRP